MVRNQSPSFVGHDDAHRYIYIKNGNAVTQLERIMALEKKITSGPDAFLYDLLQHISGAEILILSQHLEKMLLKCKGISARVYPLSRSYPSKLFVSTTLFVKVLLSLFSYKPSRVLCGRLGPMLWAATAYSVFRSVPFVYSCHNRVIDNKGRWSRRVIDKLNLYCLRRSSAAICHGSYLSEHLRSLNVGRTGVFEFDVGFQDMLVNNLSNMRKSIDKLLATRYILFVGRIETSKGVYDLLNAFISILPGFSDLQLLYAGDGAEVVNLKRKVDSLGLTDKVMVLGELSRAELSDVISNSVFMVTPTHEDFPEGRCMAAMEALVHGVPVVAPNFGPFPHLVEDRVNGLLYIPDSVEGLKECMRILLNDESLYMALKEGARKSGRKLINPRMTFGEAVLTAFSASEKCS